MTNHVFAPNKVAFLLETEAALGNAQLMQIAVEEPAPEPPRYRTNYIGSKQRLIDWLWSQTPTGTKVVFDAFSGSAAVAYMFKSKGLKVIANDRLRIGYHMARAIVENQRETLSDDAVDALLASNPKAGSFVRDNYSGLYFHAGVHKRIDTIRANIEQLGGYKKDIALFALLRACLLATDHGTFASTAADTRGLVTNGEQFDKAFRKFVDKVNGLVFDNGLENRVIHGDVLAALPKVQADVAYFDPPYLTQFGRWNYETHYHFVEGLMTNWTGLELDNGKLKRFKTDHKALTEQTAPAFFEAFLGAAGHIPTWLLSYRNKAIPTRRQIQSILEKSGRALKIRTQKHVYSKFNKHKTDANNAKEYLFVATQDQDPQIAEETTARANSGEPLGRARFEIDGNIKLIEPQSTAKLTHNGAPLPQFRSVLCHAGTNRNGDHFTFEELTRAARTAINKKVNLEHGQAIEDIVGGIVDADFIATDGPRVEIIGELFTDEFPLARRVRKLMKVGIVKQVSMECSYREGECSICRQRFKETHAYCLHLARFKGKKFQGQPVYEILHGVEFTGVGLLSREGADQDAKITQVSSVNPHTISPQVEGESSMTHDANEWKIRYEQAEREKQELSMRLEQQVKLVEVKKIMDLYKLNKVYFPSEEAGERELARLANLSMEALEATKVTLETFAKNRPLDQKASLESVRPRDVPDEEISGSDCQFGGKNLEDSLTRGLMLAYHDRFIEKIF